MHFVSKKLKLESIRDDVGVQLMPVDPEDMWHANNLIAQGDLVMAKTTRRVRKQLQEGKDVSQRMQLNLAIRVTSTFFDPLVSSLRVSGTVESENEHVSLGQHHTIDLEVNRAFTLWKQHGWDSVALHALREALDGRPDAICAVVMAEDVANICLVTEYRTVVKQRVRAHVPKTARKEDARTQRFFDRVLDTLLRNVDFAEPRPLLLAGPAFVASNFRTHMLERGQLRADKTLMRVAKDAVVVHASTGSVHSLNEVLQSREVRATMREKRFARETKLMDDFYAMMRKDQPRAWYGLKQVEQAVREGAVGRGGGVLFVNHGLFRNPDAAVRRRYVALVDKVKQDGGEARILSSDHDSGKRLDQLGGIAAILTYPMYDMEEEEGEEEGAATII